MSYRLPTSSPARYVTLAEALKLILRDGFRPAEGVSLDAAVYSACPFITQNAFARKSGSPLVPTNPYGYFAIEPQGVVDALMAGARDGDLMVADLPKGGLERGTIDWLNGGVVINDYLFFPTLDMDEVRRLFTDQDVPAHNPPISLAALKSFLQRFVDPTKPQSEWRMLAKTHFADKRITERRWREAWDAVPAAQKRRQGENAATVASRAKR